MNSGVMGEEGASKVDKYRAQILTNNCVAVYCSVATPYSLDPFSRTTATVPSSTNRDR